VGVEREPVQLGREKKNNLRYFAAFC